jgi:hypothetical protein
VPILNCASSDVHNQNTPTRIGTKMRSIITMKNFNPDARSISRQNNYFIAYF